MKITSLYFNFILIAAASSCKPPASTSAEQQNETGELAPTSPIGDLAAECDRYPQGCSAYDLLVKSNYSTSCVGLWDQVQDGPGSPAMYAFDDYGNVYTKSTIAGAPSKGKDGKTYVTTMNGYFNRVGTQGPGIDIPARISEIMGSKAVGKVPYPTFPLGYRETMGTSVGLHDAVTVVAPTMIAVRASSPWLEKVAPDTREWILFQVIPAPAEIFNRDTEIAAHARTLRGLIFSMCVPLGKMGEGPSQRLTVLQQMDVKFEGKAAQRTAEGWDRLHKGMVTFVEAAPGTGEIAQLYKGCYLGEKSCFRAVIVVTANVAGYATLGGGKVAAVIGSKGYLAAVTVGAIANAAEGGMLVKDSWDLAKNKNYGLAALAAGGAILRFVAAGGMTFEALKVASNMAKLQELEKMAQALSASDDAVNACCNRAAPVQKQFIEPYELLPDGSVKINPTMKMISQGEAPSLNPGGDTLFVLTVKQAKLDLRTGQEIIMDGVAAVQKADGTLKAAKFGHTTLHTAGEAPANAIGGTVNAANVRVPGGAAQGGLVMDNNSGRFAKFLSGDTRPALMAAGREMSMHTSGPVQVKWFDWAAIRAAGNPSTAAPIELGVWLNGKWIAPIQGSAAGAAPLAAPQKLRLDD